MAAVMNLLKRIVVSSMRRKGLCYLGLFAVSIFITNDVVVEVKGQESTEIRNQPQHELYSPSVPNGEKSTRIGMNDGDLLPWYIDFIHLPSDGMFILLYCDYYFLKSA